MNLFLWAGISLSGNVNVSQKGEGSKALFFFSDIQFGGKYSLKSAPLASQTVAILADTMTSNTIFGG